MMPICTVDVGDVLAQVQGQVGLITLNRPRALNALTLDMVRVLTRVLRAWQQDDRVLAVAIRGSHKDGAFGHFCAGGDIRFLHDAGRDKHPDVEAFFTEEYTLNHLIHTFGKPYVAFMDGVVMGGGMGISQGATCRIVTERTKIAMPETIIGLFPDVGGGYFLSRCPGSVGEWLALTGHTIHASQALEVQLADRFVPCDQQEPLWQQLGQGRWVDAENFTQWLHAKTQAQADPPEGGAALPRASIDEFFSLDSVPAIVQALERSALPWAQETAQALHKRSPLMLFVVLQQIRNARQMSLAQDLRMERDMVYHCFHLRPEHSETLEGIRALAVDKDHQPRWNPAHIRDVSPEMVQAFFQSPWTAQQHPLRDLV